MTLPIRYDDDGKGKFSSVEAILEFNSSLANLCVIGFVNQDARTERWGIMIIICSLVAIAFGLVIAHASTTIR